MLLAGAALFNWKGGNAIFFNPLMVFLGYSWMALLYLCVLLLAVTQPQSWLGWILRWGWLRWLGSIAYGVYLIHLQLAVLVFRFVRHSDHLQLHTGYDVAAMILALVLTLAICHVSFHYFEKPLIQFGHQSPIRSITVTARVFGN